LDGLFEIGNGTTAFIKRGDVIDYLVDYNSFTFILHQSTS